MSKKFLVMSAAVALAAVVMVLAYLSEPAGQSQPQTTQPGGRQQDGTVDPSWGQAGNFDPTGRGGTSRIPVQSAGKSEFRRMNEKGQLEIYKGDPITPLPGGWWEVGKPEFIYNLGTDRAMRLTANTGKLYAPAEPRAGELLGQVVLEYFDTKDEQQKVELASDSADLQFRMVMSDVKFDRDLFRLETDGPFHMTSPQFDFVGQHLRLVYSDVNRRIETLEVQKSKWLRIRPQSREERRAAAQARAIKAASHTATQPATTQPATTQPASAKPVGPSVAASQPAREKEAKPVQFYRAVFPLKVSIQSPQVQVTCDELSLVFSLQDHDGGQTKLLEGMSASPSNSPSNVSDDRAPQIMAAMLEAGGSPLQQAMLQLVAWSLAQTQGVDENALPQDALTVASRNFARHSLAAPTADDIIITWEGRLSVEPLTTQVSHLALAGAEDVYVQMTGRPVRIVGERGEVVQSASLDYLVSAGRMTLLGDGAYPVELDSPQLGGVLEARNFTLDQNNGKGQVVGPGILRAYRDNQAAGMMAAGPSSNDASKRDVKTNRLPTDFSIGWAGGLDLSFYKKPGKNSDAAGNATSHAAHGRDAFKQDPVQISAIQGAVFHGDVSVSHPRFDVRSDQLAMAMGPPGDGRQAMENIKATGAVRVGVRGEIASQQANITSDDMTVELGTDEQGRVEAKRMLANGNVVAVTAEGTLKTSSLIAILNSRELLRGDSSTTTGATAATTGAAGDGQKGSRPPARVVHLTLVTEATDAAGLAVQAAPVSVDAFAASFMPAMLAPEGMELPLAAQTDAGRQQPIRQLIANHAVEIELGEPSTRILAQRLVSDFGPLETQIELFGSETEPVRVQREGVLVTGPRVIFTRNAKTIHIPGAGMMQFYSKAPLKLNADGVPVQSSVKSTEDQTPATLVNVTWAEAMHFDDRGGAAQFLGDVLVRGSQGNDSSQIACQDLRLEFVRTSEDSFGVTDPTAMTDQEKMARRIRQVRSVVARDDVVFEAQAMGPQDKLKDKTNAARPESRVRIVGPLVTFDGLREQVQVIGPGSMLIEDYRPARKPAKGKVETPSVMVGRGATAFRWQGGMVLDAAYNDMIISEQVQMIHAPIDNSQRFQLYAGHLVADMENTGGLGSITKAGTPQVKSVFADQNVRLFTDGKQVTTDHLEYDGVKEMVLLSADTGKYTTISEAKTPVPLTYRQIKWYLRGNRFEGIAPGRGFIPLLQDSRRDANRNAK